MSWFDTAGLANLAKTALKEAQKQIDKALDIKDDDTLIVGESNKVLSRTEPSSPTDIMRPSNSSPALSTVQSSVWGSFSGSFFENQATEQNETVTTPPTSLRKIEEFSNQAKSDLSSESESLEILSNPTTPGSSLTSPGPTNLSSVSTILGSESVEILGTDTPTSENISSNTSSVVPSNINSPSSVEVISEDSFDNYNQNKDFEDILGNDDDEDDSISYNTVSDTVAAVTVIEPSNINVKSKGIITTPPSRSSLHLSLGGSFNISNISDESNESDQTIGSTNDKVKDISSNPTESMLEDAMLEKCSVESFDVTTQLSDSTQSFENVHSSNIISSYHQHQSIVSDVAPDSSPTLSSDSKNSDIVKICSTQNSGHNSGDEIETATSSDIEIISSPNGDSSSTNSIYRISPKATSSTLLAKSRGFEILGTNIGDITKRKGHSRDLSEISIRSDDSSQNENEKICELQSLLETRQFKLVELERQNADLQKKYNEIVEKTQSNFELNHVTEEYTQRMSALEKKFQQSIRERDQLRKQFDSIKSEQAARVDKDHFDKVVKDKEHVVNELRLEGEKLSKQVLQHSNIIKRLRAKEKENETTLKKQKEQIEELTEEVERLKKSLSAKDEVERSQIEAVHKLSSEKRKLEKENYQYASQLEDVTQKLDTIQKSFDAVKIELCDKKQAHTELTRKTEELTTLESQNKIFYSQKEQMLNEIDELREKLRQAETTICTKEQILRLEKADLLRRLEEAELRSEENAQAVSVATIPLVKQLESLQSTLNSRAFAFENRERQLMDQLDLVQNKLANQNDVEQSSKEHVAHLVSTVSNLEERLSTVLLKSEQTISLLQQKELEFELATRDLKKQIEDFKTIQNKNEQAIDKYKSRIIELEDQLNLEKENVKLEKQKCFDKEKHLLMLESSSTINDEVNTLQGDEKRDSVGSSPTHSLARISLTESQASYIWPLDDLDFIPTNRQIGPESIYGSNNLASIGHAPFLESLQAALKQRDGEVHQLQWELSRLQTERTYLTSEISTLTSDIDTIKERLETHKSLEAQFSELQQQYDAILQMYGEKVEETQELKLDLQDVKEMYKAQIDELLRQQKLSNVTLGDKFSHNQN